VGVIAPENVPLATALAEPANTVINEAGQR
jgi:hypothetical protein